MFEHVSVQHSVTNAHELALTKRRRLYLFPGSLVGFLLKPVWIFLAALSGLVPRQFCKPSRKRSTKCRQDYLQVDAGSRSESVMYCSHLQPAWQWGLSHKPRYLQAELCNLLAWGALEPHKEESHTTCSAGALVLWSGTWWPGQNLSALGYLKANHNSAQAL